MQKKFIVVVLAIVFVISIIPIVNSGNPQPSPLNNILYLHTSGTTSFGNKWIGEIWMNADKDDENSTQNYRETTTRNQNVVIEFPHSPVLENDLEFDMTKNITVAIALEVYYGNIDSNLTATLYNGNEILGRGETEFLGQSYTYTNATYYFYFLPNIEYVYAEDNLKLIISFHVDNETNLEIYTDSGQSYIILPLKGMKTTLIFIEPNGIDDIADNLFKIEWMVVDPKENQKISLYYDNDNFGNDGKLIVNDLPITTTEYNWQTTSIENNTYWYIYAIISDGQNISVFYSDRKIQIKRFSSVNLPEILNVKVKPEGGDINTEFTFTITYLDRQNYKPIFVKIFIDGKEHEMTPIEISDTIYSDGKDYKFSTKLNEGKHIYYFKVGNGKGENKTGEFSLNVEKEKTILPFDFIFVIGILVLVGVLILTGVWKRKLRHK